MHHTNSGRFPFRRTHALLLLLVLAAGLALAGCETKSFLDPSARIGRWDRTPLVIPILDRLDVIDEPSADPPGLTQVRPEDLVPSVHEYIMGPGDVISISVFELYVPLQDSIQTRRVDELGIIRLPEIGTVKAEGLTPSQLEAKVSDILQTKGKLKDPQVGVIVQDSRQNTFSVIGESNTTTGTRIGTYNILSKDFRIMDAMSLAGGVPGTTKKVFLIRQAPLVPTRIEGPMPVVETGSGTPKPAAPPPVVPAAGPASQPADLIQGLLQGIEPKGPAPVPAPPPAPAPGSPDAPKTAPGAGSTGPAAPAPLATGLDDDAAGNPWVNVDGKWVRRDQPTIKPVANRRPSAEGDAGEALMAQRIIEIPWDRLLDGDMRYNVVVRPGDTIRVPAQTSGNVYVGGQIARPGSYGLPGDKDLTLKQLVFAAGNLASLAVPERVDLIRRVGRNQEATVRLNLTAIFNGTEPDIFLKPNDTINFGTNFMAYPLAILRSGMRTSYGFGFVLDRNFNNQVFGPGG